MKPEILILISFVVGSLAFWENLILTYEIWHSARNVSRRTPQYEKCTWFSSLPDCRGFESKGMVVQVALIEKAPSFAYEKPIP